MNVPQHAAREINEVVGARIKSKRTVLGLTCDDLGEAAGASAATIERYENGDVRVPAQHLLEIAKRLHVPLTEFFVLPASEGEKRERTRAQAEESEEAIQIQSALRAIADPGKRRLVLNLMRDFVAAERNASGFPGRSL